MLKLRVLYVFSLIVLAGLLVFIFWKSVGTGTKYTEVMREQLIQAENEWIVQLDISNHEGLDRRYAINASVGGKGYTETFLIPPKGMFTFIYHIYPEEVSENNVVFSIYREGETDPFERVVYDLSRQRRMKVAGWKVNTKAKISVA